MGVLPTNLSVATSRDGLLHVHPIDIQLTDGSVVTMRRDAVQVNRPTERQPFLAADRVLPWPALVVLACLSAQEYRYRPAGSVLRASCEGYRRRISS